MASYIVVIDPARQKRYRLNIRGDVAQLTGQTVMQALQATLPAHVLSPHASLQVTSNSDSEGHSVRVTRDEETPLGLTNGATLILLQPNEQREYKRDEVRQSGNNNNNNEGEIKAACQLSFCSAAGESRPSRRPLRTPRIAPTPIPTTTTNGAGRDGTHSPSPHRPAHTSTTTITTTTTMPSALRFLLPHAGQGTSAAALSVTTLSPSSSTVFSASTSSSPQITPSSAFIVPVLHTSGNSMHGYRPEVQEDNERRVDGTRRTSDSAYSTDGIDRRRRVGEVRSELARESRVQNAQVNNVHSRSKHSHSKHSARPPVKNNGLTYSTTQRNKALAPPVSALEDRPHTLTSSISPPRSSMRLLSPSLEQIESQRYFQSYLSTNTEDNNNNLNDKGNAEQLLVHEQQQQKGDIDNRQANNDAATSMTPHKPRSENEPPLLFTMPDGAYYDASENASENVRRLGEWLGLVQPALKLDELTHSCIVSVEEEYTLLITYDACTERLYLYSSLLTELPPPELRLMLYEYLLEKALLGREMCGGGVGLSLDKQVLMLSTSLYMPTCQPWALRTITPHFVRCLQHWRHEVAALLVQWSGHATQ